MQRLGVHRHLRDLVLDAMFVVLVAHFLATGHVVPPALVDLLTDNPPVVAVSPVDSPHQSPDAPLPHNDSPDETPDT
jgi:hypothetical protein